MSTTNMKSGSDQDAVHALWTILEEVGLTNDDLSSAVSGPLRLLESALLALSEGRVAAALEQFADRFTFNDRALSLEFTDKARLTEFFEKSRELFPDARLEVVFLFESGNHAVAQWKITATQTVPYGSMSYRFPVWLYGATVVRVDDGKIVEWSDYYDQGSSRRFNLAASFTEWFEY